MKSVKVVDMSASDINENFLSNIALIRRLSTFKNSKAAHKSCVGAPEVQLCSIVEPARTDQVGLATYSAGNEAGLAVQGQNNYGLRNENMAKVTQALDAIAIHPAVNASKNHNNEQDGRRPAARIQGATQKPKPSKW